MSYTPVSGQIYSPQPQQPPHHFYSATPPPPPPKPSGSSTPARGPPLPPPPPGASQQSGPSELDGDQGQSTQQQPALPPIPTIDSDWLPETLKEKNTADLHALLQDPSLQAALLDAPETQHPAVPASHQALRPLIESNVQLATSLLELETRLAQQREAVQSRLLALRALEQQHRTKLAETEDALSGFSPMALYQRLSGSVQEQDQLLRSLEESWLDEGGVASERELTDFVRRVREGRKVGFLRRERKERWDEGRVGGWR
ncbi:hypothetical protein KC367_g4372 [Hortaea werneckii]|uniref:VPS37 C-terminal domain-containing protein n=1 Tax=Hortaea werneckii EXF-2000 TaxID=1157616 RepID=A0A1Z5TQD3_HORWE|nr:hypothetical protein KC350_g13537 [Hortaea werneckii]OTA38226.1 hypothetical protein BTJ68_01609 [Hortaea werneckii EXF-2000]KAI6819211.1 hypothetical protein KC342_g14173 [Hortaea werneckii]KAI6834452.1 hypothetical protein KC358_g5800 [Hortaea werneckii]KAI6931015.1 hypothetical protein KC341_g9867 [Hortaea werneckii]